MTQVMGVVNVTPDSFVEDLRTPDVAGAVARVDQLVAEGATIIDVGGESTRPGAAEVSPDEEIARVVPVIEALDERLPASVRMSVDTRNELVARAAIAAGATILNDMSASLGTIAGELGVGYVAGHMQGTPGSMQTEPHYDDVVADVLEALTAVASHARASGAPEVWIDPGIGFGKTTDHNLALIAHLDRFVASGYKVLIGVSRKSLIGHLHAASDARAEIGAIEPTATTDRLEGSLAIASWSAALGVDIIRAHDVAETIQATKVVVAGLSV